MAKLQQVCADLISCRVSIERPQQHQRVGNPYRVRLNLKAPGEEIVTLRESSNGNMHDPLAKVITNAFTAARRQRREYRERKQGEVKFHPEQQIQAFVVRLFPGEDYESIWGNKRRRLDMPAVSLQNRRPRRFIG